MRSTSRVLTVPNPVSLPDPQNMFLPQGASCRFASKACKPGVIAIAVVGARPVSPVSAQTAMVRNLKESALMAWAKVTGIIWRYQETAPRMRRARLGQCSGMTSERHALGPGEATHAVLIQPGEEILVGNGPALSRARCRPVHARCASARYCAGDVAGERP